MKIALIIAFYNGSEYFDHAIKSAYNQTINFDEIIVVDDGSDDQESEWLKNYKFKSTVKLLHKKNGGQGSARNFGVENSNSDYICFLDQDDYLLEEHNFILKNALQNSDFPRGWAYGNFNTANEKGDVVSRKSMPGNAISPLLNIYQMLDHDLFILPSASMICRRSFIAVGGFDTQFKGYEDDDLFVRLFLSGVSYTLIDRSVYVWRMHGNQTSGSIKMSRSRLKFIKKWTNYNFGCGVNKELISRSIYNRFEKTIIRELINSRKTEEIHDLKEIAIEFYNCFNFSSLFTRIKTKFKLFLVSCFNQNILIYLAKIYQLKMIIFKK